jgi:hypothetical protein
MSNLYTFRFRMWEGHFGRSLKERKRIRCNSRCRANTSRESKIARLSEELGNDLTDDARYLLLDILAEPVTQELEDKQRNMGSASDGEDDRLSTGLDAAATAVGKGSSDVILALGQRFSRLDVLMIIVLVLQTLTLAVLIVAVGAMLVVAITLISAGGNGLDASSYLPEI